MDALEKLEILAQAAKYDVACTSSGVSRRGVSGKLGAVAQGGLCHSFSADGRCITLLKVLQTNVCACDCAYCVNRKSNDIPRAAFEPRELGDLTIAFYRRNYIEGLFLSSGILKNPDYTMEQMIRTARILREEYGFRGYIHAKGIPGASAELVTQLGLLVDRMSVNIELPSQASLDYLAPEKASQSVVKPMKLIRDSIEEHKEHAQLARRNHLFKTDAKFAPAGQSTQMIIGATPETDHHILKLTEGFYREFGLKRVFYSAYLPVNDDARLPSLAAQVPLTREHRLYQADWLLRFYGFEADELLSAQAPDLEKDIDPKAAWALRHMDLFPLEVNRASCEELLRVPGIGVKGAHRIVRARRTGRLSFDGLRRMGISLKRAGYFLMCNGRLADGFDVDPAAARASMENATRETGAGRKSRRGAAAGQLELFGDSCAGGQDPYARPGYHDGLKAAAQRQLLKANVVKYRELGGNHAAAQTPSGLPTFDPLLLEAS